MAKDPLHNPDALPLPEGSAEAHFDKTMATIKDAGSEDIKKSDSHSLDSKWWDKDARHGQV